MTKIISADSEGIKEAAGIIRKGGLVAFPTETVYGLGADAHNGKAVASIFEAKGRPVFNPLIVHVSDKDMLHGIVEYEGYAMSTEKIQKLIEVFCPGPLTLILNRKQDTKVSPLVSAGLNTVAVRIPSNETAQELIKEANVPIAAPSANASGRISPTTAQHVLKTLDNKIDAVIQGERCIIGVESTVLNLCAETPVILRHGAVLKEDIEQTLGIKILSVGSGESSISQELLSPGMTSSHYAPSIPLRMNAADVGNDEALLAFGDDSRIHGGAYRLNLSPSEDLREAAANLFYMLQELDSKRYSSIAVMPISMQGLGIAINDKLARALRS
ncbi:MAG: L-threonylcarbamoyladenylate synthase [Alphaproteobacteria bacterium]|nr:L-threonylcarbamoyladenylate synthase [Alphaproteobacteria bacterium]MCL2504968.1 L-threonylcarbamoyladenylate synthase [Alphaproteobacteria bacterium]